MWLVLVENWIITNNHFHLFKIDFKHEYYPIPPLKFEKYKNHKLIVKKQSIKKNCYVPAIFLSIVPFSFIALTAPSTKINLALHPCRWRKTIGFPLDPTDHGGGWIFNPG